MILTSPAKEVVVVSFLQITQRSSIVAMSVTPQVRDKPKNSTQNSSQLVQMPTVSVHLPLKEGMFNTLCLTTK
jgi:hypothetical protein